MPFQFLSGLEHKKATGARQRIDLIARAYLDGVPLTEIAARFGVDQSYATIIAKRRGLPLRGYDHLKAKPKPKPVRLPRPAKEPLPPKPLGRPRKISDEMLERARILWADPSLTLSQIAAEFRISDTALYRWLGPRPRRSKRHTVRRWSNAPVSTWIKVERSP